MAYTTNSFIFISKLVNVKFCVMQNELNNQETKKPAKDTIWLAEFDTRPSKFKIAVLLLVMTYMLKSQKKGITKKLQNLVAHQA